MQMTELNNIQYFYHSVGWTKVLVDFKIAGEYNIPSFPRICINNLVHELLKLQMQQKVIRKRFEDKIRKSLCKLSTLLFY